NNILYINPRVFIMSIREIVIKQLKVFLVFILLSSLFLMMLAGIFWGVNDAPYNDCSSTFVVREYTSYTQWNKEYMILIGDMIKGNGKHIYNSQLYGIFPCSDSFQECMNKTEQKYPRNTTISHC